MRYQKIAEGLVLCFYLRRDACSSQPTIVSEPNISGGNVAGGDSDRQHLSVFRKAKID